MIKFILLTNFCLSLSSLSYAGIFSWSKNVSKEGPIPGRGPASLGEVFETKVLKAVDPNSFRFNDHRRKKKLTVLVFGDSGTGEKDQYQVANRMHEECQKEGCDFGILLGDIIYPNGIEDSLRNIISSSDLDSINRKFEKPYKSFGDFDFWLVPGNHDWYGDVQLSINYTLKSTRWKMPYNHYEIPWLPKWLSMYGLDTTWFKVIDLLSFKFGYKWLFRGLSPVGRKSSDFTSTAALISKD